MKDDLPLWATIVGIVLCCAAMSSNLIWYYILLKKFEVPQAWYMNKNFWKKASPWSCVVVIVVTNGLVAILQTDSRESKFSNGVCAGLDLAACFFSLVLTGKLLLHVPNYGTGAGFICNLLFTAFKVAASVQVFQYKNTSWQAFGSMAMLLAMGSFIPVLHDLVEK